MKLNLKDQRIGFSSDLHLFHHNIIQYSNRPFKDIMEMNEAIRDNHNRIFGKRDIIFNLGDAIVIPRYKHNLSYINSIEGLLKSFHGEIYYIPGNHERQLDYIARCWKVLPQLYEISVYEPDGKRQNIVMCHYAMRVWNRSHHGSWHLFGHSHGDLCNDLNIPMVAHETSLSMDVGIDCNNYKPFLYEDIKNHMLTKKFKPVDHHGNDS